MCKYTVNCPMPWGALTLRSQTKKWRLSVQQELSFRNTKKCSIFFKFYSELKVSIRLVLSMMISTLSLSTSKRIHEPGFFTTIYTEDIGRLARLTYFELFTATVILNWPNGHKHFWIYMSESHRFPSGWQCLKVLFIFSRLKRANWYVCK